METETILILFLGFIIGCLTTIVVFYIYKMFSENVPRYSSNKVHQSHPAPKPPKLSPQYSKDWGMPNKNQKHQNSYEGPSSSGYLNNREGVHPSLSRQSDFDGGVGTESRTVDGTTNLTVDMSRDGAFSLSFKARVIDDYNKAVLNDDFGTFRKTYGSRIKRVGPEENSSETATLIEKNAGDYYAIQEDGDGYLVLPRLSIVFADFHYGPGRMGAVFDCQGFNPTLTYSRVNVVSPAKFRLRGDGVFTLQNIGCLDMGVGK